MTREEAIRILDSETTIEALAEIEYYAGFSGKKAMLHAVYDALDIAVQAMREAERPRWILVTERLPDNELWECQKKYNQDDVEVLVMIKGAKEPTTLYYGDDGDFNDDEGNSWLVTHWMPLPEPPKEKT